MARWPERDKGTPQGSAVSPVLANLFLHYAFDLFLEREFPTVEFERFADDAVVHCVTERQARQVRAALTERLAERRAASCTPAKPRSCTARTVTGGGEHEYTSFTFLGYTFRPRAGQGKNGKIFTSFLPAISPEALKAKSQMAPRLADAHAHRHIAWTSSPSAINPIVAGWMNYYGRFDRSELYPSCAASTPT